MFIYTVNFDMFIHESCGFTTADHITVAVINDIGRCPNCQGDLDEATQVEGEIEIWRAA